MTPVLDAWLKGEDHAGWLKGPNVDVPAVSVLVRKGNPGFNTTEAEVTFKFRSENEWPIARTRYVKHYLQSDKTMKTSAPTEGGKDFELQALGKGAPVNFEVKFEEETEINGHPTANLVYSVPKRADGSSPKDIDVFLTLRHLDANGREIYYTGTAGDPVPLCKGQYKSSEFYPTHGRTESLNFLVYDPDRLAPSVHAQDRRILTSTPTLPPSQELRVERRLARPAEY
jgi:hypothetical protein